MLSISLSLLQLAMPILVSLAAAIYLRNVTQRLLVDLCGTEDRALFWARCAVITILAVPLVVVLLIVKTPGECSTAEIAGCLIHVVRQTLAWTVVGVLVAVRVITFSVGRRIRRETSTPQPGRSAS